MTVNVIRLTYLFFVVCMSVMHCFASRVFASDIIPTLHLLQIKNKQQ